MPKRLRLFYSGLIATLLVIPAANLYTALASRSDIWWTPMPLALSVANSRDRVEIYVGEEQLGRLLEQGRLSVTNQGASRALAPEELRLRFNNWDRQRVARLPVLLGAAAACGGGVVLLLLVATGRLAYRGPVAPTSV